MSCLSSLGINLTSLTLPFPNSIAFIFMHIPPSLSAPPNCSRAQSWAWVLKGCGGRIESFYIMAPMKISLHLIPRPETHLALESTNCSTDLHADTVCFKQLKQNNILNKIVWVWSCSEFKHGHFIFFLLPFPPHSCSPSKYARYKKLQDPVLHQY